MISSISSPVTCRLTTTNLRHGMSDAAKTVLHTNITYLRWYLACHNLNLCVVSFWLSTNDELRPLNRKGKAMLGRYRSVASAIQESLSLRERTWLFLIKP
ncbi:hypothetical protein FPOAC2_06765 [Fusarium poae]